VANTAVQIRGVKTYIRIRVQNIRLALTLHILK